MEGRVSCEFSCVLYSIGYDDDDNQWIDKDKAKATHRKGDDKERQQPKDKQESSCNILATSNRQRSNRLFAVFGRENPKKINLKKLHRMPIFKYRTDQKLPLREEQGSRRFNQTTQHSEAAGFNYGSEETRASSKQQQQQNTSSDGTDEASVWSSSVESPTVTSASSPSDDVSTPYDESVIDESTLGGDDDTRTATSLSTYDPQIDEGHIPPPRPTLQHPAHRWKHALRQSHPLSPQQTLVKFEDYPDEDEDDEVEDDQTGYYEDDETSFLSKPKYIDDDNVTCQTRSSHGSSSSEIFTHSIVSATDASSSSPSTSNSRQRHYSQYDPKQRYTTTPQFHQRQTISRNSANENHRSGRSAKLGGGGGGIVDDDAESQGAQSRVSSTGVKSHQGIFTVTVFKDKPNAKIGIKVGMKYFEKPLGPKLEVTHIDPVGPFGDTPVECGDIVLALNGQEFGTSELKTTAHAVGIVRNARESCTIMIQKRVQPPQHEEEEQRVINSEKTELQSVKDDDDGDDDTISTISRRTGVTTNVGTDRASERREEEVTPTAQDVAMLRQHRMRQQSGKRGLQPIADDMKMEIGRSQSFATNVTGNKSVASSSTTKRHRRKFLNSDGSLSIVTDRLHNHHISTRKPDPVPVYSRETITVSGDTILSVPQLTKDMKIGLTITEQKSYEGNESIDACCLVVDEITRDSIFASTPLTVGDTILVVNEHDFRNCTSDDTAQNIQHFYNAIESSRDQELVLCARKSSTSLKPFLNKDSMKTTSRANAPVLVSSPGRKQRSIQPQTPPRQPPGRRKSEQTNNRQGQASPAGNAAARGIETSRLDEVSYDDSIGTYNSSKRIILHKSHPREELGIEFMQCQVSHVSSSLAATVLVISNIHPSAAERPKWMDVLQVGDCVLKINGMSFEDQPDVDLAYQELRDAQAEVVIEFQRLPNNSISDGLEENVSSISQISPQFLETHHSQLLDEEEAGTAISRTTRSSHNLSDVENVRSMDVSTLGSVLSGVEDTIVAGNLTTEERQLEQRRSTKDGLWSSRASVASQISCIMPIVKKSSVESITIAKAHPDEEIGLSMQVSKGVLYVAEVSPIGLLAGKAILPGDKIVAINGQNFEEDPDPMEAATVVANALAVVNFEIERTKKSRKTSKEKRFSPLNICNKLCKKLTGSTRALPDKLTGSKRLDPTEHAPEVTAQNNQEENGDGDKWLKRLACSKRLNLVEEAEALKMNHQQDCLDDEDEENEDKDKTGGGNANVEEEEGDKENNEEDEQESESEEEPFDEEYNI